MNYPCTKLFLFVMAVRVLVVVVDGMRQCQKREEKEMRINTRKLEGTTKHASKKVEDQQSPTRTKSKC